MKHWNRIAALVVLAAALNAAPFPTVYYGVSYYHEYMPYERLDRDVEMMQQAGISVVRLGESTWSSWEPRDGVFQFEWMDRVLDRLHRAGIKVIMGTPTYSIPPWLFKKHPEIIVTRFGTAPPMSDPYNGTYPGNVTPGAYGPRQNMDLTHPEYRRHCERIIRQIAQRYRNHPAIIGFQVDNETGPNGLPLPNVQRAFVERLKRQYKTPHELNRLWGLAYWGQLVDNWEEFPPRDGILNPGYKLEWERFQQEIVREFLDWQAKILREYVGQDKFITHNFVGGIRTNLAAEQIARNMDIAATNPYFTWQDRFNGIEMSLSGDFCRSLKNQNYLVTETNAQTIGWDSRAQFPPYDGQLRLAAYANIASGANMIAYWHWHSLHYGQETYWRGVLSHDLQPNRAYREVSRIGAELRKFGPQLANLEKRNQVAILYSNDSYHAIQYMPFHDRVNYLSVLNQMYGALYRMNVEADFVFPGDTNLSRYRVLLVPPLYSASDSLLQRIADYVRGGGHVVMAFKSGFTNEHSTVRWDLAPGPLREAAGIHYQEFTTLATPVKLQPVAGGRSDTADTDRASVWAELLVAEKATPLYRYESEFLRPYPAVTRNRFGQGTLTYEGAYLSDELQSTLLRDTLTMARVRIDDRFPASVRVKHGRNAKRQEVHFFLNFSGAAQTVTYSFGAGVNLLTGQRAAPGAALTLGPWDLAIVTEDAATP